MTEPELLPCPFCGNDEPRKFRHTRLMKEPCVMCPRCAASAVSVTAWNTRVDLPRPEDAARIRELEAYIARWQKY